MGNTRVRIPPDFTSRIKQVLLAGGIYKITRKGIGRGIIGLALPAVALLVEDLSNPNGVVLPFLRWLLSRHGRIKIIEMSCRSRKDTGKAGMKTEETDRK